MESREWYQLVSNYQKGAIVSGNLDAVEVVKYDDKYEDAGVVFYGDYKILIPLGEMDLIDVNYDVPREKIRSVMRGQLGAKIDCIITKIDKDTQTIIASRRKANEAMRKRHKIEVGTEVNVDVVGVSRVDAIVALNGFQVRVPINEIGWGMIYDIRDYIKVGSKVKMLVTKVEYEKDIDNELTAEDAAEGKISNIELSLRALQDEPYQKYVVEREFYKQDGEYRAQIRKIKNNGIYVEFRPGISALCNFPNWENYNPSIGQYVSVMIKKINTEKRYINGAIIREL